MPEIHGKKLVFEQTHTCAVLFDSQTFMQSTADIYILSSLFYIFFPINVSFPPKCMSLRNKARSIFMDILIHYTHIRCPFYWMEKGKDPIDQLTQGLRWSLTFMIHRFLNVEDIFSFILSFSSDTRTHKERERKREWVSLWVMQERRSKTDINVIYLFIFFYVYVFFSFHFS